MVSFAIFLSDQDLTKNLRYEWLDPSIKKTEWSKEEDEKLLHLAKLMPTQWRTIAPIVGRTANQCLDRYQRLLDEAEARESSAPKPIDEVRKLKVGEIDPDPETKPAKPDPIDMDEDEKEMLSEARARLLNTQGKKAKRKARERQLEQARRAAYIEKRRELKDQGIRIGLKSRMRNEIDWNAKIPLEIKPAAGFYDVEEERSRPAPKFKFTTGDEFKEPRKKRDDSSPAKPVKKQESDTDFLAALEEPKFSKRRKLNLPSPQIGEREIDEIVKVGQGDEEARISMQDQNEGFATNSLIVDYQSQLNARVSEQKTPAFKTPLTHDNVRTEASNLLALQNAPTPLIGGDNTELKQGGTGFCGVTPNRQELHTPSVMASVAQSRRGFGSATPGLGNSGFDAQSIMTTQSKASTFRDSFNINKFEDESTVQERTFEDLDSFQLAPERSMQEQLEIDFSNLPKPKNDFDILIPEEDSGLEPVLEEEETQIEEDQADIRLRNEKARKSEESRLQKRQSEAVKRNLPIPKKNFKLEKSKNIVQNLLDAELHKLIRRDLTDRYDYEMDSDLLDSHFEKSEILLAKEVEKLDENTLESISTSLDEIRRKLDSSKKSEIQLKEKEYKYLLIKKRLSKLIKINENLTSTIKSETSGFCEKHKELTADISRLHKELMSLMFSWPQLEN